MSQEAATSHRHNDYVGSDANAARIPGAENSTTGHQYVAVFPKETPSHQQASSGGAPRRADEHLPPPTGRDRPPASDQGPSAEQIRAVKLAELQQKAERDPLSLNEPRIGDVVIDPNPYAERTSVGDTLTGATSQDAYNNSLGQPGSGMSSKEMHHDGMTKRKRQELGKDQYGHGEIPREEPPY